MNELLHRIFAVFVSREEAFQHLTDLALCDKLALKEHKDMEEVSWGKLVDLEFDDFRDGLCENLLDVSVLLNQSLSKFTHYLVLVSQLKYL